MDVRDRAYWQSLDRRITALTRRVTTVEAAVQSLVHADEIAEAVAHAVAKDHRTALHSWQLRVFFAGGLVAILSSVVATLHDLGVIG